MSFRRAVVSAPGKLILMGEHAVVYGHPAIVAAVDRRLTVTAERREGDGVSLDLPALHHRGRRSWDEIVASHHEARSTWRREFLGDEPTPRDRRGDRIPPEELVVLALGETARFLGGPPDIGLDLTIESSIPIGAGFGSSAAVSVAVPGALLTLLRGVADSRDVRRVAIEIERFQHGLPSGIDDTAVLSGGVLVARADPRAGDLDASAVRFPSILDRVRVFHSGSPTEPTGVVVAEVRRRMTESPEEIRGFLAEIGDATSDLLRILADHGEPEAYLEPVRRAEAALEGIGVVPEATRRVIRSIEARGGAAKISGAGSLTGSGAGSVLVFYPDPDPIDHWSFLGRWRRLPVRLGAEGLRQEELAV